MAGPDSSRAGLFALVQYEAVGGFLPIEVPAAERLSAGPLANAARWQRLSTAALGDLQLHASPGIRFSWRHGSRQSVVIVLRSQAGDRRCGDRTILPLRLLT